MRDRAERGGEETEETVPGMEDPEDADKAARTRALEQEGARKDERIRALEQGAKKAGAAANNPYSVRADALAGS